MGCIALVVDAGAGGQLSRLYWSRAIELRAESGRRRRKKGSERGEESCSCLADATEGGPGRGSWIEAQRERESEREREQEQERERAENEPSPITTM